ncbi:hypothetical protein [Pseudomonas putida]|uniref:hypothetical protein n=1 Tax=Pseudomonas putida TaxID=303 RepID=UPI00300EF687
MVYDVSYYFISCNSGPDLAPWVAIIVSFLALGATIWQSRVSREHNRLSVRPHLGAHNSWTDDRIFKFEVRNDGLGPAIITAARIYRNGELVEGKGSSLVVKAFEGVPGCKLQGHEFFYPEYVVPAGQVIEICTLEYGPGIDNIETFLSDYLLLEIDYKSAYNERLPMFSTRIKD